MSLTAVEEAMGSAGENFAPGFVAMARFADGRTYRGAFGRRSLAGPAPMTQDALFWIASMTKLVTSIAALQLIEDGALSLDQTVASVLPEFAELPILDGFEADGAAIQRKATDAPTIRHLLTHTSGLGYHMMDAELARYAEQADLGPDPFRRLPRRFEAGARWQYGLSHDWLGLAVATVAGEGLDTYFERRIFAELGMVDTTFVPAPAQRWRLAAMHARQADGSLAPIDFAFRAPPYFLMGGGGLYSTAADYMSLLAALLAGGLLRPASIEGLLTNQVGDLACGVLRSSDPTLTNDFDPIPGHPKRWSLGMMVNPAPGPDGRAAGSAGWAGLGNCYYWLDPSSRVAGLLLTQILPFADPEVLTLFSVLERAVYA
ncbi:MAG: serine hydrolase domain-containing protein [Caulobacteraceae bacterium]